MSQLKLFFMGMPLVALLALLFASSSRNSTFLTPKPTAELTASATTALATPISGSSTGLTSGPIRSAAFTDADFNRHVTGLKARIKNKLASSGSERRSSRHSSRGSVASSRESSIDPASDFSIIIQKPFVVIGDEPKEVVQQHATNTIKWAVDRLKQDFFTKDPNEILEIWLFKDEVSYRTHARLMFGDEPSTPYGYYSPSHKALIMNIGTGGGTLVHEIVHPFMEANFPACPPWLNEGLGSLYEQCGEKDGHIHGFTNWRLPGLQRAIREKRVPSFKTLMEMNSNAFYNEDKGTNYAQARYLCYYLQEKGLLVKFYREFLATQKEDATGFKSLQNVLGETDMEAFKTKWEKFVLGLRQGYEVTVQ